MCISILSSESYNEIKVLGSACNLLVYQRVNVLFGESNRNIRKKWALTAIYAAL